MTTYCQCFNCTHFVNDGKYTCKAFPKGVPDDILFGEADHKKPYKGDNDIQFEEKKK